MSGLKFYDYNNEVWYDRPYINDELDEFTNWWLDIRSFRPPANDCPLDFNGNLHGVTLYRDGEWQVQLLSIKPNSIIIEHRHPNVDTYEVYFSGQHVLGMNSKVLYTLEDLAKLQDPQLPTPFGFGVATRIAPPDWHWVKFGEQGGSFLSIQKWLNGVKPTSVGHDWEEKGENHEVKVVDNLY